MRFRRQFLQLNLFFQILLLLVVGVILVYYTPSSFNKIAFLLFLIPLWATKKDFLWLAFFLVILDTPGGLFSGGTLDDTYRLPVYNLAAGISFSFTELFILTLFIKAIVNGDKKMIKNFPYRRQYQVIVLLLIILIIISFFLGTSLNSLRDLYKNLINLTLFYSAIYVFRNHEAIVDFFRALFPFVFIALLLQIYGMTTNSQLIALFKHGVTTTQGVLTGELERPIEMALVVLLCSFGSFLFLGERPSTFRKSYLLLINVIALISIIMTATRSWFLGFVSIYLFFIILNYRNINRVVFIYFFSGMLFAIVMFFLPVIRDQVRDAFSRIGTITELASGDLTAGGTLSRLTERAPRVMEGFWNSTIIFGAGYSDLYYKYADGHVGFHNILLHAGVFGLIIFMGFAIALFYKPIHLSRRSPMPPHVNIVRNLPLLVPAVLIITSGTQFWGFNVGDGRALLLASYIAICGYYLGYARPDEILKYQLKKRSDNFKNARLITP